MVRREGAGDQQAHILGDALVGVVGLTRHELHPVIGAVGQPGAEVALGEPAPPADLQHLVEVELVDGHDDVQAREPGEADDLVDEDRVILVLQRVVEGVVPLVQEDIDVDDPEIERDDDEEQSPAPPSGPPRTSTGGRWPRHHEAVGVGQSWRRLPGSIPGLSPRVAIAQMDGASDYESEGQRFDSSQVCQFPTGSP